MFVCLCVCGRTLAPGAAARSTEHGPPGSTDPRAGAIEDRIGEGRISSVFVFFVLKFSLDEPGAAAPTDAAAEEQGRDLAPVATLFRAAGTMLLDIYNRAEVRRSFITTTVWDGSQVTPQGRHR